MFDFDTVVIGSGVGGLTAAVSLARTGERVLVLEQHDVPGGWCHSFTIGGHRFSPGVHYLGELGEGGRTRRILEGLEVAGDLEMLELNPDGYDHALIAGTRFDIPSGLERYKDRLKSRFSAERDAIDRYFALTQAMATELATSVDLDGDRPKKWPPPLLKMPTVLRHGLFSLTGLFESAGVRDPMLRAILASQAGDHGLAPSDIPAAVHASVAAHYFDGGHYPAGGGFTIPRAFLRALKKHGGELRTSTRVERILIEEAGGQKRAAGVLLAGGETISARRVISNADPHMTYLRLVGQEHLGRLLLARLKRTKYSVSALSLFCAADLDAGALGLDSGNYWYLSTTAVDEVYRRAQSVRSVEVEDFPGLFLTVTTLKDPGKYKGQHTMEAFTFVPYEAFRTWAHSKYGARPEGYRAMKEALTQKMLRAAEKIVPGLASKVSFVDLGTPLTNEHYVAATAGNLYGTEKSRWQIGPFGFQLRSGVRDLWMVGASTLGHGVLGAMMSGLVAAAAIARAPIRTILAERGPTLRTRSPGEVARERAPAPQPPVRRGAQEAVRGG